MTPLLPLKSSHLNNALLYYLPPSLFPFLCFFEAPFSIFFFHVCGPFFCMYEHGVSSIYRNHSTTRRSHPSQSSKASREFGSSQHVVEHLYSSLRSRSERRKINSARPTIIYNREVGHFAVNINSVTRERFAIISNFNKIKRCPFSPSFFYVFRTCMRHPGCSPGAWSSWHLQVVILHLVS